MRMLLIEKSGILIQNGVEAVSFKDLAELKFYSNVDLTSVVGDKRVGYEPDRGIHTEFDGVETLVRDEEYKPYDSLIKNVGLLRSRKENPFYGISGSALTTKEAEIANQLAAQAKATEIKEAKSAAQLDQYTIKQAEEWITKELTDAPNTVAGVKQAIGKILFRVLPYLLSK